MWKKLLLALGAPIVFLLLLELVLVVVGVGAGREPGDPYVGFTSVLPLFVPGRSADGNAVLRTAESRLSHFNYQQFPQRKAPGTFRVFCLGGSTTYGRPYDDRTSFCGWLREFLRSAAPGRRWEVINCGGLSYASYRIVMLMEELQRYDPDLFVVYTGHNEFLERRTYAGMYATPKAVRMLGGWASRTRTYTALASLLRGDRRGERPLAAREMLPAEVDALLDNSIGPSAYERDDALQGKVLTHFEHGLSRMADLARHAGAGIVFATPASNLADCSPFKGEEASRWYREGRKLVAEGRHGEALAAYRRARDEDVCPLRALSVMPGMVRSTAQRHGVPCVDYEALVAEASPHGIPGRNLFLDHVHPTVEGNRLLALAILDTLRGMGLVPHSADTGEALQETVRRVEGSLDARAHATALRNLAKVLGWAGKFDEADRLIEQAAALLPDDPDTQETLGVLLLRRGRLDEAAAALERALGLNPDLGRAYYELGLVRDRQGRAADARSAYEDAVRLEPGHPDAHHKLGLVLLKRGDVEGAARHYGEAVRLEPRHALAHYGLGFLFMQRGDYAPAAEHYRKAIESEPEYASAHKNLGVVYLAQGRTEAAVACFEEALRLAPGDPGIAENLRVVRRSVGGEGD